MRNPSEEFTAKLDKIPTYLRLRKALRWKALQWLWSTDRKEQPPLSSGIVHVPLSTHFCNLRILSHLLLSIPRRIIRTATSQVRKLSFTDITELVECLSAWSRQSKFESKSMWAENPGSWASMVVQHADSPPAAPASHRGTLWCPSCSTSEPAPSSWSEKSAEGD